VDERGIVLEGPTTNVWWRVGEELRTPALSLGILAGETRAAVSELASGCGYRVVEVEAPLAELLAAAEAFTTSSVREVMPVVRVDDHAFPRGPAAEVLQAALRRAAGVEL
jgi:branched-chain amino acid aminotransferase